MQQIILPTGETLRYFADLDEFPAERRSHFTKYQIEAAEIDLTPEAITNRIAGILQFNAEGKTEFVQTALTNLLFSFNAIRMQYAPDLLSLGAVTYDIDGQLITDFSPDGLMRVLSPLKIPVSVIQQILDEVKKNSTLTGTATSLGLLLALD